MPAKAHCCPRKVGGGWYPVSKGVPPPHFVIPAQAGTQAVPKLAVSGGAGEPVSGLVVPAMRLALQRGAAWVPACAGMTE
jgi:hypothetical protein